MSFFFFLILFSYFSSISFWFLFSCNFSSVFSFINEFEESSFSLLLLKSEISFSLDILIYPLTILIVLSSPEFSSLLFLLLSISLFISLLFSSLLIISLIFLSVLNLISSLIFKFSFNSSFFSSLSSFSLFLFVYLFIIFSILLLISLLFFCGVFTKVLSFLVSSLTFLFFSIKELSSSLKSFSSASSFPSKMGVNSV